MTFSVENDFTYMIYRDESVSTSLYDAAPLKFFPEKDSDELHDALRAKYPHLKKHSERMGQATIEFLNEERLAKEQTEQASHNGHIWQGMEWPLLQDDDLSSLIDLESFSGSSMTSPFTSSTQDASPWQSSPEMTNLSYTADTSRHGSFQADSTRTTDELGGMSGVFSLVPGDSIKQRTRRKMTEAEKVEYRKRRTMKACESCSKRKRKCNHSQNEKTTAKTIAKSSCTPGMPSTGPTWDLDAFINLDELSSPLDGMQDADLFHTYCDTTIRETIASRHPSRQWSSSGSSSISAPVMKSHVPSASSGGAELGRLQELPQGPLQVEAVLRGRHQEQLQRRDLQNTVLDDRLDHDRVLNGGLPQDRLDQRLPQQQANRRMSLHGSMQPESLNHSMGPEDGVLQGRQLLDEAQARLLDGGSSRDTTSANSNSIRQPSSLTSHAIKARLQRLTSGTSAGRSLSPTTTSSNNLLSASDAPDTLTSIHHENELPTLSLADPKTLFDTTAEKNVHTVRALLTKSSLIQHQRDLDGYLSRKIVNAVTGAWHGLQRSGSPSEELWRLRRRSSICCNKDNQINPIRAQIPPSTTPVSVYRIEGAERQPEAGFLRPEAQALAKRDRAPVSEASAIQRRASSPANSGSSSTTQLGLQAQEDRKRYLCWYRDHHGRQQLAKHLVLACLLVAALLARLDTILSTSAVICALLALNCLAQSMPSKDLLHSSMMRSWRRLTSDAGLLYSRIV